MDLTKKKKPVPPIMGRQEAEVEAPPTSLTSMTPRPLSLPSPMEQNVSAPSPLQASNPISSFQVDRPVISPLEQARTDYINAVNSKPEHQKPGLQALHFILEGIKKFTNPNDTSPVMWLGEAKRQRAINEAEGRLKPLLAMQEQQLGTDYKKEQLAGLQLNNQGQAIQNQLGAVKAGDYINDVGITDIFDQGDTKYGVTPRGNVKPLPVPKDLNKSSYPYKTQSGQTVMAPGSTVIGADQNALERKEAEKREATRIAEKNRSSDDEKRDNYYESMKKYRAELNDYNLKKADAQNKYDSEIDKETSYNEEAATYEKQAEEARRSLNDDTLITSERQAIQKQISELTIKAQQSKAKAKAARVNAQNYQRTLKTIAAPTTPQAPTYSRSNGKAVNMSQIRQAAQGYKNQQAAKNISVSDEEALEYATEMARSQGYTIEPEKQSKPKKKK